jgi:hypothetical protein
VIYRQLWNENTYQVKVANRDLYSAYRSLHLRKNYNQEKKYTESPAKTKAHQTNHDIFFYGYITGELDGIGLAG